MTKFADELYSDLMREHGSALADITPSAASRRHIASRRVLLATGAGGLAVAATAGALVATAGAPAATAGAPAASGATPAYALTTGQDGTVTLAVYKSSGIAQVNAKLHQLGDNVVVVPVRAGCPSIHSLPAPAVPAKVIPINVEISKSKDGSITVQAKGIPAGDIMVIGFVTTPHGKNGVAAITSPPAPACISQTAGPGKAVRSGNVHHTHAGSGTSVSVHA